MRRNIEKRIISFTLALVMILCSVFVLEGSATNCYAASNVSDLTCPDLPSGINPITDAIIIFDDYEHPEGSLKLWVISNGVTNGIKFRTNNTFSGSLNFISNSAASWSFWRYNPTVGNTWVKEVSDNYNNPLYLDLYCITSFNAAKSHVRFTNINFYSNTGFTDIWIPASSWDLPNLSYRDDLDCPNLPSGVNPITDVIIIFDDYEKENSEGLRLWVISNGVTNGVKFRANNTFTRWISSVSNSAVSWSFWRYNPTVSDTWVKEVSDSYNNPLYLDLFGITSFIAAKSHIRFTNINFYSNTAFTDIWIPADTWNAPMTDVTSQFVKKWITIQSKVNNNFLFAEKFYIQDAGDGWIAFIAPNGKYLSATDLLYSMESPPVCVESSILLESTCFKTYQQGDDYYIQSRVNERYLEIPSDSLNWSTVPVKASAVEPSNEARFAIVETTPLPPPYVYLVGASNLSFAGVNGRISSAANAFSNAGAIVATDIDPTYSQIYANHNVGSRSKLRSDYLFFLGHGTEDAILADAPLQIGSTADLAIVTRVGTTRPNVFLFNMNWSDVKLVVFAGCDTAKGFGITDSGLTDPNDAANIAQEAYLRGADCAIGWDFEVYANSLGPWCENFNLALAEGKTVNEAIAYANSDNYIWNSVKNVRVYGNGNFRIVNP